MQSPRQKPKKSLLNSNNKQPNTYGKIAECFTQYLGRMFQDFSLILTEKLKCQQQKIKHNQQLLRSVANMLEIKEKTSSTSLEEIQSSFNRQKKSITIERRFQDLELEKVLKSFERIEDNIKHLQKSLKLSKLSHSIQDPQIKSNYSNKNQIEPFAQDPSSWFGQQKSRISKLTKRINQLARQVSCKQIESQIQNPNSLHDESRFCKSQSLISLSKRRFYPKSCPKINQYGSSILLKKNLSQNQIHYQSNLEENIVSLISTHQSSNYKDQNKMPLINKMKTTINDIVNSVRDLNDFKVIKFFLKKALRQISQRPLKDQILNSTNQYINQEKSRPISNIKGQIYVKKQIVPQYFVSKNLDPLQIHEQQGIYQVQSQMKRNNHKHASNELLLKENYKSPNKQNVNSSVQKASIQKRKYFQRTSNEQKIITMLKRKVKPF